MDVICFRMTPTNAVCLNAACYVKMKRISAKILLNQEYSQWSSLCLVVIFRYEVNLLL